MILLVDLKSKLRVPWQLSSLMFEKGGNLKTTEHKQRATLMKVFIEHRNSCEFPKHFLPTYKTNKSYLFNDVDILPYHLRTKPANFYCMVSTRTCVTEYVFWISKTAKSQSGVYSYDEIQKNRKNGRKCFPLLRFTFHASRFRWLREVPNDVRGRARSFVFRLKISRTCVNKAR